MSIRKIKQAQLIRVFKDLKNHPDDGCCFLLGAGASVTSGIPSGGELARRWYAELKEDMHNNELDAWHQEIGFDANRVAEFYPRIFERRFRDHSVTGYYQLQDSMKDAEPSIGYSFLAQVLAKTQHKYVITTNFDHMVEDAIRTYTAERPLVCVMNRWRNTSTPGASVPRSSKSIAKGSTGTAGMKAKSTTKFAPR